MTDAVLDASVFISAISPAEVHHPAALALMELVPASRPFLVPAIFPLEVVAALAWRGEPDALVDSVAARLGGPRFHAVAIDDALLGRAMDVARRAHLRAYDALYVALALERGASLLTLDDDVRRRATQAFPALAND